MKTRSHYLSPRKSTDDKKKKPNLLIRVDGNKNAINGKESRASRVHYREVTGGSARAQRSETAPKSVDDGADNIVEVRFESDEQKVSYVSSLVESFGAKSLRNDTTDNALDGLEREHKHRPGKLHEPLHYIISKVKTYGIDGSSEPQKGKRKTRLAAPLTPGMNRSTAPQRLKHNTNDELQAISRETVSQVNPGSQSPNIAEAAAPSQRVGNPQNRTPPARLGTPLPEGDGETSDKDIFRDVSKICLRLSQAPVRHRVRTPSDKHICTYCGKQEPYKCRLVQHLRAHTGEKPFPCNLCEKRFSRSTSLSEHIGTHTGKQPHRCTLCHRSYARRAHLVIHTRTHTGEKPFGCTVCGKLFGNNRSLVIHRRIHTGEKPFPCTLCEKRFSLSGALTVHTRSHTKEQPFECVVCEKRFSTTSGVKKHMRCHTGEKPYKCTACSKGYSSKNVLRKHMASHTGEVSYDCVLCGLKVPLKTALTKHMNIHTGTRPYKCSECGKKVSRKKLMIVHLLIHKEKDGVDFPL